MGRPAKHPIQTFNGVKFYWKPSGYYKAQSRETTSYMHRYVWEHYNGPLPAGHHVHHRNGDKSDNRIENLELMCSREHNSHHNSINKQDPARLKAMQDHAARIRPLAAAWHSSPEGRQWHIEHGKKTWEGREMEKHSCRHCGQDYEVLQGVKKRGFCSPKCQSAFRRASGVDNETRVCEACGEKFEVNRYSPTKTCSRACGGRVGAHKRHHGY